MPAAAPKQGELATGGDRPGSKPAHFRSLVYQARRTPRQNRPSRHQARPLSFAGVPSKADSPPKLTFPVPSPPCCDRAVQTGQVSHSKRRSQQQACPISFAGVPSKADSPPKLTFPVPSPPCCDRAVQTGQVSHSKRRSQQQARPLSPAAAPNEADSQPKPPLPAPNPPTFARRRTKATKATAKKRLG